MVFGIVDASKSPGLRYYMQIVDKRNANKLPFLMQKQVSPQGTIVFGSGGLLIMEYVPSKIFSNPVTGCPHTTLELY